MNNIKQKVARYNNALISEHELRAAVSLENMASDANTYQVLFSGSKAVCLLNGQMINAS